MLIILLKKFQNQQFSVFWGAYITNDEMNFFNSNVVLWAITTSKYKILFIFCKIIFYLPKFFLFIYIPKYASFSHLWKSKPRFGIVGLILVYYLLLAQQSWWNIHCKILFFAFGYYYSLSVIFSEKISFSFPQIFLAYLNVDKF